MSDSVTSIPDFNEYGFLPDGVYPCDDTALRTRFVDGFPDSPTRLGIYEGFIRWRQKAQQMVPAGTQWVNGSYVTTIMDPEDIDVVTFCDASLLDSLDAETEERIERHLNGQEANQPRYMTHSILVGVYPPNHAQWVLYEAERKYWLKWWGRYFLKKEKNAPRMAPDGTPKGFLLMIMGDASEVPHVSSERTP